MFLAEGLALRRRDGSSEVLSWDTWGTAWTIIGHGPQGLGAPGGFDVTVAPDRPGRRPRRTWLPSRWSAPPFDEVMALVELLHTSPGARRGLDRPDAVAAFMVALTSGHWKEPRPPDPPLPGRRGQLAHQVEAALDARGWRRLRGRPVRGEPRPDAAQVAEDVHAHLPHDLRPHFGLADVRQVVDRSLAIGAWPFDVLLTAPSSSDRPLPSG